MLTSRITPRTKALLINTPHNPTGRVFDDTEMAALIEVVTENDLEWLSTPQRDIWYVR